MLRWVWRPALWMPYAARGAPRSAGSGLGEEGEEKTVGTRGRRRRAVTSLDGFVIFSITLLLGCRRAHADPIVELSGATGLGVLAVGVTQGRFALSPSASFSVRGERGFFVARDTVSFLGVNGGRFGFNNETTLGGGLFWDLVNVSAGLSLAGFSLPTCGPRLCGQMLGLAPGASVRLDLFGPYLSGALGVSVDCAAAWIMGGASPVWSGVSVRCSAGHLLRFTSHK